MNKKGKNKKGKVPNPPHEEKLGDKLDLGVISDDGNQGKSSKTVEETIESVKEERVPEIISEIIPPHIETRDEESPKKPKRNRGKKKKGKEDDLETNLEKESKESDEKPVLDQSSNNILEAEPVELPIVPTVRKKKNKKKNEEQKTEEPIPSDIEQITLPTTNIKNEPEVAQEIPLHIESAEPEVKPSKKKNKKKKRNDSETCEKEEISCTTGFKKLMEAKDEAPAFKVEDSYEDTVMPVKSTEPESEIISGKNNSVEEIIVEMNIENQKPNEPQQLPTPEGKSKKKNKKDKKHSPQSVENTSAFKEDIANVISFSAENIAKEECSKDIVEIVKPEIIVQKTSPKPKAKIAKPVEKKSKGNQDIQPDESTLHVTISDEQSPRVELESAETKVIKEETLRVVTESPIQDSQQEPIDFSIPQTSTKNKTGFKPHDSISQQEPTDFIIPQASTENIAEIKPHDSESLNISSVAIGKKRKKGSKVPRTPDVSFEILDSQHETDPKKNEFEIFPSNLEQPSVSETGVIQKQEESKRSDSSDVNITVDPALESKLKVDLPCEPSTPDHVLLTPESFEEGKPVQYDTLAVERKDDAKKNETKSGKKRRKSPKPPQKDEHKQQATEQVTQVAIQAADFTPTLEEIKNVEEKMDNSDITRIYDIEISSIKADESEGSPCETIPDITYPRSVSQQLMDDNNNRTVIREIFPLQVVLDTQKQDNVKAATLEVTTKSQEKKVPPKEEKTDIKSKMMEVNQDMEELRLSIERSLAELTSMENNEEVTEKASEGCGLEIQENFNIIMQADTMSRKNDTEIVCQDAQAKKTEIEKSIEQLKVTEECQKQLEKPLLLLDDKTSKNIDIQQADFEIFQPESTKCATESKTKVIIIDESKNISPTTVEPKEGLVPSTTEKKTIENLETAKQEKVDEFPATTVSLTLPVDNTTVELKTKEKSQEKDLKEKDAQPDTPPVCPERKDNKNKHKKKKGKQNIQTTSQPTQSTQGTTTQSATTTQEVKREEKTDTKTENKSGSKDTKEKGKQQSSSANELNEQDLSDFEPIENFEDALTSSVDDVNKTFELIVNETQEQCNPKINITAPDEEKPPVSPPKNLLGHPDIPVSSNKRDYKKEKDKIPNEITATVKIKDAVDVERKQSKNTQTTNKLKDLKNCKLSANEEFVYKYNFRKVFLQSSCHVCNKNLGGARLPCCYCNLVFYCGTKHKDEDWPLHQALCFAVCTIGHLKDQKHIYGDIKNITGQDYRLIRMQMIVSCEKVLKRRLVPWEQEALLYPRFCAHVPCREWRQNKLSDCQGCGQISFCKDYPDHYPKSHSRWCKSYSLYQKLVCYQQTKGRLEPRLPTKVMQEYYKIPENINEVLAAMYEEKIDMNDIQYAALTQLATAPLTAAYCHQMYRRNNITTNGYKKSIFTIHVVGAELQFEADALNKWEVFFLHLRPDLQELRVVLINYNLNPSNLPLELLGKIKLCDQCRQDKRRVVMHFQDKRTYADYKTSEDFITPDLICAFNPSIQRSSVYNGKDPWPSTINVILKQKTPFIITSYSITELNKDCIRIKECSEVELKFICEPKLNCFASVRPDRNFITDDETPLLFKNNCYAIICG
ncbi:unnamed protein product [Arctia plantaginis]|uniref:MYND-type domain-containing protein n=1 Tax=Arctia plantaginis TaxID=874455 RepID=A0A8S1A765_ARCPL|nr:unnamed protein product [Arctia plantaginis]